MRADLLHVHLHVHRMHTACTLRVHVHVRMCMCMCMYMHARRRAADLLRACAAAHGRGAVSVLDLAAVLPHVLWDAPDEASTLAEWVEDHVLPAPHGQKSP